MSNTLNYYHNHTSELIQRYDNAAMQHLHSILLKYLIPNSTVIDIGFGSGRDLELLSLNKYDIWGIDPTLGFIENAKRRFPKNTEHFFVEQIPFQDPAFQLPQQLDAAIVIAVWMHLPHSLYKPAVNDLVSLLKQNTTIILSYSLHNRIDDERYFERVDRPLLKKLLKEKGFQLIYEDICQDSLGRDELSWVCEVYKRDQC